MKITTERYHQNIKRYIAFITEFDIWNHKRIISLGKNDFVFEIMILFELISVIYRPK